MSAREDTDVSLLAFVVRNVCWIFRVDHDFDALSMSDSNLNLIKSYCRRYDANIWVKKMIENNIHLMKNVNALYSKNWGCMLLFSQQYGSETLWTFLFLFIVRSIENKPNTHTIRALYIRSYIKVREKGDKLQCSCSCELCWEFVSDISSSVSSPHFYTATF